MKYTVTYENSFNEPFYKQKNKKTSVKHILVDSYIVNSVELCKDMVKNFLDIPNAELTLDSILKDFSSHDFPLSEQKAIQIQTYYNGRFALYNTIIKDLDTTKDWKQLIYDIPEKYNSFDIDSKDVKQHYSRITIQKNGK